MLLYYTLCPDMVLLFSVCCFTVLRAELSLLKQHVEAQAKELDHRMHKIEELEEKERLANESVCYFYSIDQSNYCTSHLLYLHER